jgi:hypothetical protein
MDLALPAADPPHASAAKPCPVLVDSDLSMVNILAEFTGRLRALPVWAQPEIIVYLQ